MQPKKKTEAEKAAMRLLVDRLCAKPAKDTTDLGVRPATIRNEIGDALERNTASIEHATRVVELLVYAKYRPGPGEIRAAAEETILPAERAAMRAAEIVVAPAADCGECDGTGWKPVYRGGLSGVAECSCRAPRPRPPEYPEFGPAEEGVRQAPGIMVKADRILPTGGREDAEA